MKRIIANLSILAVLFQITAVNFVFASEDEDSNDQNSDFGLEQEVLELENSIVNDSSGQLGDHLFNLVDNGFIESVEDFDQFFPEELDQVDEGIFRDPVLNPEDEELEIISTDREAGIPYGTKVFLTDFVKTPNDDGAYNDQEVEFTAHIVIDYVGVDYVLQMTLRRDEDFIYVVVDLYDDNGKKTDTYVTQTPVDSVKNILASSISDGDKASVLVNSLMNSNMTLANALSNPFGVIIFDVMKSFFTDTIGDTDMKVLDFLNLLGVGGSDNGAVDEDKINNPLQSSDDESGDETYVKNVIVDDSNSTSDSNEDDSGKITNDNEGKNDAQKNPLSVESDEDEEETPEEDCLDLQSDSCGEGIVLPSVVVGGHDWGFNLLFDDGQNDTADCDYRNNDDCADAGFSTDEELEDLHVAGGDSCDQRNDQDNCVGNVEEASEADFQRYDVGPEVGDLM